MIKDGEAKEEEEEDDDNPGVVVGLHLLDMGEVNPEHGWEPHTKAGGGGVEVVVERGISGYRSNRKLASAKPTRTSREAHDGVPWVVGCRGGREPPQVPRLLLSHGEEEDDDHEEVDEVVA